MRSMMNYALVAAVTLATTAAFAHSYEVGEIAIGHPHAMATPGGATTAAVDMTLDNQGKAADRLLGGSSPAADEVEIHKMSLDNGIMKMRPLADGIEIPAGDKVALKDAGYHLMLIGLKAPLKAGEMVPLTLRFEKAGKVDVKVLVDKLGSDGGHGAHQMDMKGEMKGQMDMKGSKG